MIVGTCCGLDRRQAGQVVCSEGKRGDEMKRAVVRRWRLGATLYGSVMLLVVVAVCTVGETSASSHVHVQCEPEHFLVGETAQSLQVKVLCACMKCTRFLLCMQASMSRLLILV